MTIRCITFDLDDTLWECKPVIIRAEQRFYDWLSQHYPKITERYSFDQMLTHRMAYMKARPELHHDLTRLRKLWLASLADDAHYDQSLVEQGFRVFWLARNEVEFYHGAIDILEQLAKEYTLGVITNGNADVNHIGVGDLFSFSVHAEEAGAAKPHPDIFQLALKKANLPPQQVLHIGDDPDKDVRGAKKAGMLAIWVNFSNTSWEGEYPPDAIVTRLNELESTIKQF